MATAQGSKSIDRSIVYDAGNVAAFIKEALTQIATPSVEGGTDKKSCRRRWNAAQLDARVL